LVGVAGAATLGVTFVLVKRLKELFWIIAGFGMLTVFTTRVARSPTAPDKASASPAPREAGPRLPVGDGLMSGAG
jgi:hypothetical protein